MLWFIAIFLPEITYKEYPKVAQLSALTIFSPIGTCYLFTSSSIPRSKPI